MVSVCYFLQRNFYIYHWLLKEWAFPDFVDSIRLKLFNDNVNNNNSNNINIDTYQSLTSASTWPPRNCRLPPCWSSHPWPRSESSRRGCPCQQLPRLWRPRRPPLPPTRPVRCCSWAWAPRRWPASPWPPPLWAWRSWRPCDQPGSRCPTKCRCRRGRTEKKSHVFG